MMKIQEITKSIVAIGFILAIGQPIDAIEPSVPQTFLEWCNQSKTISKDAQRTVAALLQVAKTDNCQQADRYFQDRADLQLVDRQLNNLQPLASLTALKYLELSRNNIQDLRPLRGLKNLRFLKLDKNKIIDLKPISALNNLTYLDLSHNRISDVRPLAKLTKLVDLAMRSNRLTLTNLRSLNELPSLTTVSLEGNGFTGKTANCPIAKPGLSCIF